MREILFRGKRDDNGEWVYGYYVPACFGRFPCRPAIVPEPNGTWRPIEVKSETIRQYTGLTDKNGKKIFENDICRFDNDEPNEAERYTNYVIQWDIVNCRFVVVTADNCEDVLDRFFSEKSEIIGNLHDNPELMGAHNESI